jgi:hypothetical protein
MIQKEGMAPKYINILKTFSKESTWHRCLVAESGGNWQVSEIGKK